MAQALGSLEVGVHLSLGFAQEGEAAVDFGDDSLLFSNRGRRKCERCELRCEHVLNQAACIEAIDKSSKPLGLEDNEGELWQYLNWGQPREPLIQQTVFILGSDAYAPKEFILK